MIFLFNLRTSFFSAIIFFLFCCKLMKALREIPQGYRGVPSRKSRSALFSSVSCLTCTSRHYSNSPKKTVKQPSTRVITGFMEDLSRKKRSFTHLVFTRNNAG
uniref:Uncharacterized protein n=1 Tax=Klebsiella pneumoniae TaxID=573 RepID=A0A8B0STN3_KLEPN|nr:hypothetical protein [Klebsiella pneumoniae]